ncbi:unnamed protein product [Cunninghamella blakesleeana]
MRSTDEYSSSTLSIQEYEPLIKKEVEVKKPSYWYILLPKLFISIIHSAMNTVFVQFYINIVCSIKQNDLSNINDCNTPEIQATVSQLQAVVTFLSSLCCVLFAAYYGSISDQYGRRYIFKIHCLGEVIATAGYILLSKLNGNIVWVMLIAIPIMRNSLVGNATLGEFYQAYIADISNANNRTTAFSHMMAVKLLGFAIGPAFGGMVVKKTGSLLSVFYINLVSYFLFLIYIIMVLPESLDQSQMEKARQHYIQQPKKSIFKRLNVLSNITLLFDEKSTKSSNYKMNSYALPIISILKCILICTYLAPFLLYGMLKFDWTVYEGGIVRSISSVIKFIIVMFIFPILIQKHQLYYSKKLQQEKQLHKEEENKLNHPYHSDEGLVEDEDDVDTLGSGANSSDMKVVDHYDMNNSNDDDQKIYQDMLFNIWMVRIGLIIAAVSHVLLALATTSFSYAVFDCLLGLDILAQPTIKSLYTSLIDPSQMGTLLGVQSVLHSITILFGYTGAHLLYSISVETMPNLSFFVFAIILGLGVLLSFSLKPIKQKKY